CGEADAHGALENADRRGHRSRLADCGLRLTPDREALACREAVRDEGGLERDDSPRVAHLGRYLDHCSRSSMFTNSTSPQRSNVLTCLPVSQKPARSYTLIARVLKAAT